MNDTPSYGSSYVPISKYLFIAAFVVFCVSVIGITDVFEFPFEALLGGAVSSSLVSTGSIVSLMSQQGYLSVFVLMLLESAALPIPSEVVLPYAGYLVYKGSMNLYAAVFVSGVAGLVGAMVVFLLALKLGRPFVDGALRRVGVKPKSIDRAEKWMNTRGPWGVLVARFIPGLRSIISVPAGLFKMDPKAFVATTLVGSFVWSALLIYLGYSAGELWGTALSSSTGAFSTAILEIVAVGSVAYMFYYFYVTRSRQKRASQAST